MGSTESGYRIVATPDEFVEKTRRDIRKMSMNARPYSRASAAAYFAGRIMDFTVSANRTEEFACAKGCGYCCHIQTDISAGEAFLLAAAIRKMPDGQREGVIARLRENVGKVSAMSLTERYKAKLPCALLDADAQSCSVYDVRPSVCRKYHSLDINACENSHETGDGIPLDPKAFFFGGLVLQAYYQATGEPSGELHAGVLMALDPDAERNYFRGKPVFAGWQSTMATATDEEIETERKTLMALAEEASNF